MRYARYLDNELFIEKYIVDVTKKEVYEEDAYFEYSIKIPEQFASIFRGQRLVLTKGFGKKGYPTIVNIFLEAEWAEFEKRLNQLPTTSDQMV